MTPRREMAAFAAVLAGLVGAFLGEALVGGKVLSPADVVFAQKSFGGEAAGAYEPANRLLIDPVLQFQPWLEFSRESLRAGRLPLWNPRAGCGAPHLANGQSAVFDPFHAIAYLGALPDAWAWIAAARLWVAGLGMFVLARAWGLGAWGRWLAGLVYPFGGFLVLWLLFPVASVAAWLPWLMVATDAVMKNPGRRAVGAVALATGCVLLGGHVQTSAHVLMAAAAFVGWKWWGGSAARGAVAGWAAGVVLGVGVAAIEVLPLGFYLARSPVWEDREAGRAGVMEMTRPRLMDAACSAVPYLFGSQRRGHPNLAPAAGVHNLNEAAGGYVGLAPLLWLAPAAWAARGRRPVVRFLVALVAVGAMAAFEVPPVANLLRAVPVVKVADNRRLTLWVAFGVAMLGGIGLDGVVAATRGRAWRRWVAAWLVAAAGFGAMAAGVGAALPTLRERAEAHYGRADARAERQVANAARFLPRYYAAVGVELSALAGLALGLGRWRAARAWARPALAAVAVGELFAFGWGYNPAIGREQDRPEGPVIAYLRRECPPPARAVGVGAELPPNMLMRYGLADARNYDSVELTAAAGWLAPLYEPDRARTSRRTITWAGVVRARERLEAAGVAAVIGASEPPRGAFGRVDRVGAVWVARLDARRGDVVARPAPGVIRVWVGPDGWARVEETFDPGWRAEANGRPVRVEADRVAFLAARPAAGVRAVIFRYEPGEVRVAGVVSMLATAGAVGLVGARARRNWAEKRLGRPRGPRLESNPLSPRAPRPASSTEG